MFSVVGAVTNPSAFVAMLKVATTLPDLSSELIDWFRSMTGAA